MKVREKQLNDKMKAYFSAIEYFSSKRHVTRIHEEPWTCDRHIVTRLMYIHMPPKRQTLPHNLNFLYYVAHTATPTGTGHDTHDGIRKILKNTHHVFNTTQFYSRSVLLWSHIFNQNYLFKPYGLSILIENLIHNSPSHASRSLEATSKVLKYYIARTHNKWRSTSVCMQYPTHNVLALRVLF